MNLSDLKTGESAVITKILGHGAFRKRVMEMGFVRGQKVKSLLKAPLQDPIKFSLMDYEVSLRRSEAAMIECVTVADWEEHLSHEEKVMIQGLEAPPDSDCPDGVQDGAQVVADGQGKLPLQKMSQDGPDTQNVPDHVRHDKVINVALIGNPNCGKSSLFNAITGGHEHVGNYAGVTVDSKSGYIDYKGYRINLYDLPGTYSLSAYSPEEKYVMNYLRKTPPDVIVNVVVASNLERNLYLTTELIDMDRSMVIAMNMYDELEQSKARLDYRQLSRLLGVPMVPVSAQKNRGIDTLLDKVIDVYELRDPCMRHIHVPLGADIEKCVRLLVDELKLDPDLPQSFSPRYIAIKLLQGDVEMENLVKSTKRGPDIIKMRDEQFQALKDGEREDPDSAISAGKYGFVAGALGETLQKDVKDEHRTTTIIDAFVTNRLFGFPVFLLVMWLMFWCTFTIGQYPMDWIEAGVDWLGQHVAEWIPQGPINSLIVDGIIGGVGAVIVFLPQILILFAFMSFMEASGYMSRVAFIMDRVMHKIGLHGKSFIPLLMGFGCNVPAIISTRIIESRSSRLLTTLLIPFMSCSARIPIYVLLCGVFFPHQAAIVFFALYVLGIIVAVLTAKLFRKVWLKADETPFVMELPPYRLPTWKATMRGMWEKAQQYLRKMGGIILVAAIIVWALSYFPRTNEKEMFADRDFMTEAGYAPTSAKGEIAPIDTAQLLTQFQQQKSILGDVGHFVEPVMRPLGIDWRGTVSLLAGASAKEIVVSTLGVLFIGNDDNEAGLAERLTAPSPITHRPPFTPVSAMAFMVFVLLYFPCVATLAAIKKETGRWKYVWLSLGYNTALAYVAGLLVYQIGSLF